MAIGPDDFRAVLGRFASGVTVLTVQMPDGRDHGMTASAFCSVSLTPPMVLACVDQSTEMHTLLQDVDYFGVNILEESQEALSRRFAELPAARFDGLGYTRAESGVVLLDDALAQMECRMVARHEAGDHTIIVGEVEWAEVQSGRPLLYYRGGYAQLER